MEWREYHEFTKHTIEKLRRSQHYLDWANMPNPYRHYEGVPLLDLQADPPAPQIPALEVLEGKAGNIVASNAAENAVAKDATAKDEAENAFAKHATAKDGAKNAVTNNRANNTPLTDGPESAIAKAGAKKAPLEGVAENTVARGGAEKAVAKDGPNNAPLKDGAEKAVAKDGAAFLSQLMFYSASISATKRAAASTYALRVNPSSGNLHPTEFHFCTRGLVDWPDGLYSLPPLVAHGGTARDWGLRLEAN